MSLICYSLPNNEKPCRANWNFIFRQNAGYKSRLPFQAPYLSTDLFIQSMYFETLV